MKIAVMSIKLMLQSYVFPFKTLLNIPISHTLKHLKIFECEKVENAHLGLLSVFRPVIGSNWEEFIFLFQTIVFKSIFTNYSVD